jgi:cytochrome P450
LNFSLVLPFGFGKRACPGRKLAEVELYITTAKLFHAFDVSLVDDLDVEFNFLLTPVGPLRMEANRRHASSS